MPPTPPDGPIAAYVRASSQASQTEPGEEGHRDTKDREKAGDPTLTTQKKAIREWASEQGVGPVDLYEDLTGADETARGFSDAAPPSERPRSEEARENLEAEDVPPAWPGLGRLLSDVESGHVETIVVYQANRLAQTLEGFLKLVGARLEPSGVRLMSITEPLDTATEPSSGVLRMLRSFPALARDRATEGRRRKAESGGHATGEIPFGYRKSEGGGIEPDPKQAPVVKRIFELRGQGESLRSIAQVLNEEDVPTKRGGRWHASTIKHILDNPKYRGRIKHSFGGTTVEAEAERLQIVD